MKAQRQHRRIAHLKSPPVHKSRALDDGAVLFRAAVRESLDVRKFESYHRTGLTVDRGHAILRCVQRRQAVDPRIHVSAIEIWETKDSRELLMERVPVPDVIAI